MDKQTITKVRLRVEKEIMIRTQLKQLDSILERYDKKDVLTPQEQAMKKELEERYQELMDQLKD